MFAAIEIGIDLGTSNILVYHPNKGIIFNEPSVMAIEPKTKKILAVGSEAKKMMGKTSKNIGIVYPMKDGVIADYDFTTEILKFIMQKISKKLSFRKPSVIICAP